MKFFGSVLPARLRPNCTEIIKFFSARLPLRMLDGFQCRALQEEYGNGSGAEPSWKGHRIQIRKSWVSAETQDYAGKHVHIYIIPIKKNKAQAQNK